MRSTMWLGAVFVAALACPARSGDVPGKSSDEIEHDGFRKRSEAAEKLKAERLAGEEAANQQKLDQAEREMNGGHFQAADRLLAEAQETTLHAERWRDLRQRLRTLQAGAGAQPVSAGQGKPASLPFQDDGQVLLKRGHYREAQTFFDKCLEIDPANAECHLALGAVYARTRKPEEGAAHYREFLRLAPGHARAADIRLLLQDYETQRSRQR